MLTEEMSDKLIRYVYQLMADNSSTDEVKTLFLLKWGGTKVIGNLLGSAAPSVEDAMNAQIRALTKGDVTKEKEVLALGIILL